jgi:hypothetical protein
VSVSKEQISHLTLHFNVPLTMTKTTMQRRAAVIYLASATTLVAGFSINNHARIPWRSPSALKVTTYGRGAEIWPECNEAPIQLADSFPGGAIPEEVLETLSRIRLPVESMSEEKKSFLPQPFRRIFSRTPEQAAMVDSKVSLDKTPTIIAAALLVSGLVRPLDVSITVAITGYLAVLHYFARSPRADGLSPHVPALPPQGHVPDLVANPLGLSFTNSNAYDSWLKMGAALSLVAPIAAILRYTVFAASQGTQMGAAKACARPLFLLCCQALAESISRKVMVSSTKIF